jgi:hypothetical protein
MMKVSGPEIDLHFKDLVISLDELWWRCFALGTMNTESELEAFLRGAARPTRHEYNVIAVAMNEYFLEVGFAQFVPYIEDDRPIVASCFESVAILAPHARY